MICEIGSLGSQSELWLYHKAYKFQIWWILMKIFYTLIPRCLYGNRNTPVIGNNICCCCLVAKLCPTLVTLWTVAHQAPLSMVFSRQEYWSGLHALLQGIFPTEGSNLCFLHSRWILYHWATRKTLGNNILKLILHGFTDLITYCIIL